MKVAVAVYYIGAGVFHFEEKDYGYGEKLPANVPAETLEKVKAHGKASETPPHSEKATGNELGTLRGQLQELSAQLATVTSERDEVTAAATRNSDEIIRMQGELSTVRDQLATVTGERDQAKATIEEMTKAQLSPTPAAPVEAGPAKK